jgi:hypothetical protein
MLNLIRNTVSNFRLTKAKQDANNFLAAAGITGQVQSQAIYNLVNDLQASGLWSKMKAVYPMVTDNRNIFSYTEDFTNAAWQKSGISAAGDTTTAPNGTLTADTIQNGSTSGYMRQVNLILSSGQYTQSAYFKKNNNDWVAVYTSDGGPNYAIAYFNINTGVVGTVSANGTFSAASSSIQNVGGGWYRCSLTFTKPTTASTDVATNIPDADNTFSRTIGQNAFIWGAQVESGTLSTYQPILTTPAAFMASQMKYNLKDARDLDAAFRLTWSGGWTYSATGATPNGTNAYADTKLVPSSVLNNANDGHLSYYSRTQSTGNYVDIGTQNGASSFDLLISYAGTLAGACINMLDSNLFSYTGATTGLFIGSQNNTPNIRKFFRNNILTQTQTVSQNEQPTTAISIGARGPANNNFYTNRQCAFASIGNGLSDNDALLFNQIVEKYQVALSRGVQAAQSFYYNSAYSNEANTYLYSTQITGTTQVSAINTLINGLKANNLWAKMKAVYPFVTDYRNLLGYTEDFTNAFWNKFNSTVTANTIIAPNGTLTADTLQENTTNTEHNVRTDLNGLIPSETYTYSNYVKYNDRRYMRIQVFYNGGIYPNYAATFDILNGVFVSQFGVSGATIIGSSITADNNGWYRITVSGQLGAFSSNIAVQTNLLNDSLAQVYTGTSKSTYIWGAQFELGSSATTYQPVLAANSSSTFMSSQMKFNLVNPQDSDAAFRLAFSGGWTYSTNGAQPNGTNGYADTKLIPSASLSTSSSHLSFYSRTNSPSGSYNGYEIARTHYALLTQFNGNKFYANLETGGVYNGVYTSTNGLGHFIASRINNTTTQGFKNGSKVIDVSQVSTLATNTLLISFNGASNYSDKQTAFASIGDGLTDAEAALLYQLVQEYQTTLNRSVV